MKRIGRSGIGFIGSYSNGCILLINILYCRGLFFCDVYFNLFYVLLIIFVCKKILSYCLLLTNP